MPLDIWQLKNRILRAQKENLFVWDYQFFDNIIKFSVQGSKGNIYKVKFDQETGLSDCSCPDYFDICKHQILVMINTFKLSPETLLLSTEEITKSIKKSIYNFHEYVNANLCHATIPYPCSDNKESGKEEEIKPRNIDEQCFICFEEFKDFHKYFCCPVCNNAIHLVCWNSWKIKKQECPLCRTLIKNKNL